ncbi:MAG TPA: TolC family protein [Vicinamibacterales bacterium]|nr:TolC family protein [Vicinamibacterales bacterium]
MIIRNHFVASVGVMLITSAIAGAQTPATKSDDQARMNGLVQQAVERFNENVQASARQNAAQTPSQSVAVVGAVSVPLSLEDAVRRATENNLDIQVERLNPQTFDLSIAGLQAVYHPTATSRYGRTDNVRLPTSLLNPGSPNISTMTYNAGVTQAMRWGGGSLTTSFNNQRQASSDVFSNFNPQFNSSLNFNYTQPLLRNFRIDSTRQAIKTTMISRDTADLNLKARTTNTLAAVRSAYWDYVYAIQAVDVARQSLTLAQKLLSDNRIRVDIGTMAPMDVVQARAEEATRQQAVTTATATMRTAELSLKRLIVSGTNDPLWAQHIEPTDRPDFQAVTVDVESAVRAALQQRTDLQVARNNMASNNVVLKSLNDQKLPAVDLTTSYGGSGLGGTSFTFAGSGLDRVKTGEIPGSYTDALSSLFDRKYPNWTMQVNVSYPIGGSAAEANAARTKLLISQNEAQIRASELTVATEVTNAALQVQNNVEGLAAARAARELSQQRLDAESSRFEVGMSTNYQVVQAQRDLRDAQNSELRALLNYRKSLVEFDRVQQAGAR